MSDDHKVWVAELDIRMGADSPVFSGSWLTVHETRESARRAIAERAMIYVPDLLAAATAQDIRTSDDVSSSTCVKDGDRELTWVINRYTVEP